MELKRLGANVLHGINAKTMMHHTYLETRLFDRIIFNFPHAGFKGQEYEMDMLMYVRYPPMVIFIFSIIILLVTKFYGSVIFHDFFS